MGEGISQYVFIDTNVLINDFFFRSRERQTGRDASVAIQFLRTKPKVTLHIASFSLIQLVSTLDKAKVPKNEIADELKRILSRFKLVDLTAKDFDLALNTTYNDTEDALQYVLCRKARCLYIVTDNIKDFKVFKLVAAIKPKFVRKIIF
jgi:predicted nucleic acid-binding protein